MFVPLQFLDFSQEFDKVSYTGLLTKLSIQLLKASCTLFQSCLKNRLLRVKNEDEYFQLREIQEVSQLSILGKHLYVLYMFISCHN